MASQRDVSFNLPSAASEGSAGLAGVEGETPDATPVHLRKPAHKPSHTEHTLDIDGDGIVTKSEMAHASRKLKNMRKRECYLLGLVALLIGCMFGTSLLAINLTTEMHVREGKLIDNSESVVATRNQVGAIEGVHLPAARRLNATDTNATDSNATAPSNLVMEITRTFFERTKAAYAKGQVDWVVTLPDGSIRTVQLLGADELTAWGFCGTCVGRLKWYSVCEDQATECFIYWLPDAGTTIYRRLDFEEGLPVGSPEAALRNRARRAAGVAVEQEEGHALERTLGSKHCV